ncbi:MAG: hypothetical protein ABEJ57_07305 [Halobacteriaceae archaeon]
MGVVRRRAQLVVLAGAVVAVALVPVLVAGLQVGATAPEPPRTVTVSDVRRGVATALATHAPRTRAYAWDRRVAAVAALKHALEPGLARVGADTAGVIRDLEYVAPPAITCPGGPARRFGACAVIDGVVVQNRGGTVHVVAIAVRVTILGPDGRVAATVVVRPPTRVIGG